MSTTRFHLGPVVLTLAVAAMACNDRASEGRADQLERHDVALAASTPACTGEVQQYVSARATEWWHKKIDPTGRDDSPFAIARDPAAAPIGGALEALRKKGLALDDDPLAHRWEVAGDRVRLSMRGSLAREGDFLVTFHLEPSDGALVVRRVTVHRGRAGLACRDGALRLVER